MFVSAILILEPCGYNVTFYNVPWRKNIQVETEK